MIKIPLFDAHCDTLTVAMDQEKSLYDNDLSVDLRRLACFSPAIQVMAVYFGAKTSCLSYFLQCVEALEKEKRAFLVKTKEDFENSREPKVILAIEGAEVLEGDLKNLRILEEKHVKAMTITWNLPNGVASSWFYDGGLTEFGRKLIPEMEKAKIAVDVSHMNDQSFFETMELSKRPVIATHSNSRTVCPHRRNLTDEQFSLLKNSGGGTGINLCPDFLTTKRTADAFDAYRHIEHFLSLGGEDSLFLGCDFDGIDETPDGLSKIEALSNLYEVLLKEGLKEELVRNLFFNNLKNIFLKFF